MNIGEKTLDTSTSKLGEKRERRFGALDGKAIFAWKMALGASYHLALAHELQAIGLVVTDVG